MSDPNITKHMYCHMSRSRHAPSDIYRKLHVFNLGVLMCHPILRLGKCTNFPKLISRTSIRSTIIPTPAQNFATITTLHEWLHEHCGTRQQYSYLQVLYLSYILQSHHAHTVSLRDRDIHQIVHMYLICRHLNFWPQVTSQ